MWILLELSVVTSQALCKWAISLYTHSPYPNGNMKICTHAKSMGSVSLLHSLLHSLKDSLSNDGHDRATYHSFFSNPLYIESRVYSSDHEKKFRRTNIWEILHNFFFWSLNKWLCIIHHMVILGQFQRQF